MKAKKLIKYDFDNMENKYPDRSECLGTFIDEYGLTANGKIDNLLKTLSDKPYTGWDGEVYPQYKILEIEID